MTELLKGKTEDMADIIDFANYVFSQSHAPHDFKALLPKLYADSKDTAQYHYMVKEDGKIKAMVLAYPTKLKLGNTVLNTFGIGTVSVHPYSRGSGYMKEIMHTIIADMREQGAQLGILGGQRQRYEYFGFEPCGLEVIFNITKTNARHTLKNLPLESISFCEIKALDTEKIKQCDDLYKTQKIFAFREPVDVYDTLISWGNKAYTINYDGHLLGYISRSNTSIGELVLNDYSKLKDVIAALLLSGEMEDITINVPFYAQEQLEFFTEICESYHVCANHNYNIMDYKAVIKACMELKAQYSTLEDGCLIIKIDDEVLEINVKNNEVTVENTTKPATLSLNHLDAMTRLFSPASGFLKAVGNSSKQAKSWFPLPLYMHNLDCV